MPPGRVIAHERRRPLAAGRRPGLARPRSARHLRPPLDPELADRFLRDPRHHLVTAIADDRPVGFVSGVDYWHPDKPRELWINEVGVACAWQNRGIGTRVMQGMLDHARALGCREAWVLTDHDNAAALALYRKVGGEPSGTGPHHVYLQAETVSDRSGSRRMLRGSEPTSAYAGGQRQSRMMSLIEAATNVVVGLVVAMATATSSSSRSSACRRRSART